MEEQIAHLTRLQNIEIDSKQTAHRIAEISQQYEVLDQRLQDFKQMMENENQQNDSIKKGVSGLRDDGSGQPESNFEEQRKIGPGQK